MLNTKLNWKEFCENCLETWGWSTAREVKTL